MGKEKEGLSINFGLNSFEILSYSYDKPEEEIDLKDLGYQIQFKPEANKENETVSIKFKVTGQIGEKDPLVLGSISTLTIYNLSNMENLITEDGKRFFLPKGLAVTLLSIALSTTRGALVAKSEGNLLSQAVLPLADPNELYEASPLKGEMEIE